VGEEVDRPVTQPPFRLEPEDGVDFPQKVQQAIEVRLFARGDQVDIVSLDWSAVQSRSVIVG